MKKTENSLMEELEELSLKPICNHADDKHVIIERYEERLMEYHRLYQAEIQKFKQEFQRLDEAYETCQKERKEWKEKACKLEDENTQKDSIICNLRSDIRDLEDGLDELNETNNTLMDERTEFKQQLTRKDRQIRWLACNAAWDEFRYYKAGDWNSKSIEELEKKIEGNIFYEDFKTAEEVIESWIRESEKACKNEKT